MRISPKSVTAISVLIVVLCGLVGEVGFHDVTKGIGYGCGIAALFVVFAGVWAMIHYQQ